MNRGALIGLSGLALAACGAEPEPEQNLQAGPVEATAALPEPSGPPVVQQAEPTPSPAPQATANWTLEGNVLRLLGRGRSLQMVIACRPDSRVLLVHVPSFTPIGSEDRLSLGLGREPVTLVADLTPRQGDPGIQAEGQVPENFATLLTQAQQITAMYGAQQVGPFPPVPAHQAAGFSKWCDGRP